MNILITHPSFPGQYFYLSRYLAMNPENRVVFLSKENGIGGNLEGVQLGIYQKPREVSAETHGYLRAAEEAVLEGQQVLKAIYSLKEKGFVPDVIIGHAGWGSLMYIKDFYPDVPVIGYFEWYYHSVKSDSYWWPDEVPDINAKLSIRTRNMHHLLSLDACDIGITPTQWQHDQFPQEYKSKIRIIHEGTDTAFCCPPEGDRPQMKIESVNLELPPGTEVITYVSRGFELIRGFDKFMEAIRIVLKHRPNCHVVIAGNDKIFYGAQLADNKTFKQIEEEKGGYDKDRVHFVGSLNRGDYRKMLQASWCHSIVIDKKLAKTTGFTEGNEAYFVRRVRYLDTKPLIMDTNIFLSSIVTDLTEEIASKSIYDYIENELGMQITTSKRTITVEHATAIDKRYLDLGSYDCMAVITSQTFNRDGIMFEYTVSRHHPEYFCFQNTATRRKS